MVIDRYSVTGYEDCEEGGWVQHIDCLAEIYAERKWAANKLRGLVKGGDGILIKSYDRSVILHWADYIESRGEDNDK